MVAEERKSSTGVAVKKEAVIELEHRNRIQMDHLMVVLVMKAGSDFRGQMKRSHSIHYWYFRLAMDSVPVSEHPSNPLNQAESMVVSSYSIGLH